MMSRRWVVVPVLALAACGSAPESAAAAKNSTPARKSGEMTRAASLPADVIAFRQRRDECDHFRGEEPYDAKRAAFLRAALARTCKGTDAQLVALRKRYARDPAALRALADYEANVEPPKDDL